MPVSHSKFYGSEHVDQRDCYRSSLIGALSTPVSFLKLFFLRPIILFYQLSRRFSSYRFGLRLTIFFP